MPNHCHNRVTFYSENESDIRKLHDIFSKGLDDDEVEASVFGHFVPEPKWEETPLSEEDQYKSLYRRKVGEVGELPVMVINEDKPFLSGLRFKSTDVNDERWYDWRCQNWGTKWDVDRHGLKFIDHGDDTASISGWFDSAWSPPIGACEEYLEHNKDCSIRLIYYEPGMDFMGIWEDFDDRCYNCSEDAPKSDSDFWETEDGKHIDDYMGVVETMQQYEEDNKEAANG